MKSLILVKPQLQHYKRSLSKYLSVILDVCGKSAL